MIYDIAIVAHESRATVANALARRVGASCLSYDDGTLEPGHNHLRTWQWLASGPQKWSIILEDDAVPSEWFLSGDLNDVLKASPSPVTSLYLGAGSPRHWQPSISQVIAGPESWLIGSELLHHVGVAIKTSVLPVILDGLASRLVDLPIDEAIGARCRNLGISIAYCKPSIVNHDTKLPSVMTDRRSQHVNEDVAKRALDESQRRAWVMADGAPVWNNSQVAIPEPSF